MTFRLNQISTAATGREIRRERTVEGETLTLGRAPENNVRLTDLAVALCHATVRRVGALRLSVSAEEGLGVELNGRKVSSGFIELASGGDVRIAGHLLRFLPTAADAEFIQVEIEQVGESAADEAERADISRFSVGAVLPGKRISAYVLAILVLGIFLAWPIWVYSTREPVDPAQFAAANRKADGSGLAQPVQASFSPDSMWSTGSLSSVHHGLEGQCSACHVKAFEPVQDTACLTCHQMEASYHGVASESPAEQLRRFNLSKPEPGGFEGFQLNLANFFGHTPGRCVDCHTEHEGREAPVIAETNCSSCHTGLSERLRQAGVNPHLGDASGFGPGSTHPEFRPSVIINWNGEDPELRRIAMDGRTPERSNLKFPHELHMRSGDAVNRMTGQLGQYGGRDQLACADCHRPTPDGARYQPVDMEQDCAACHTLQFDVQDGVYRTLRHGAPRQVIADLREYYRGRVPARPPESGPVARRRPGTFNDVRTAVVYARARAGAGPAANARIAAVFREGGACFDCHQIEQRGPLDFHVQPVGFPDRYLLHGWFDHARHTTMVLNGQSLGGDQACLSCHGNNPNEAGPTPMLAASSNAANLMLPGLESCQRCHVDEGSNVRVAGQQVPSSCALCHDYHMDGGVPSLILHRRVRGERRTTTLRPVAASTGAR